MKIRFVGIIIKQNAPEPARIGEELAAWFERRRIATRIDEIDAEMDMLVILGGDGTLLHVAARASRLDIPVVGINLGNLGFLTEVAASEIYPALETILAGKIRMEKRLMLRARLYRQANGEKSRSLFSLNEVVIAKSNTERMVRFRAWADSEYITTYKADGLIIATPTGSTAYNLSAGGPIAQPELNTLLVTPICPFMLGSRPLLLSPRTRITTQMAEPSVDVKIIIDGRPAWDMHQDDCLLVEAAGKPLQLISSPHKGYFTILRNKLNWGGRERDQPLPKLITSR